MFLQWIATHADTLMAVGLFGLMALCVIWLVRRGVHILREGTYYRTRIEGPFRWNRVYRYGGPVYAVALSSLGGAAVMLLNAGVKLFTYPLEMPFLWRIPFEAVWQGAPVPLLGYILAEWLYSRQQHRKAKRFTTDDRRPDSVQRDRPRGDHHAQPPAEIQRAEQRAAARLEDRVPEHGSERERARRAAESER